MTVISKQENAQSIQKNSLDHCSEPYSTLTIKKPVLGMCLMFVGLGLYPLSDAFVKHLLETYSVHQTTFLRAFGRLILLLLIAFIKSGTFMLKTEQPKQHLLRIGTSLITTYSFMYACSIASLTSIYTLSYTAPIFILIFSALFLREKVDSPRWIAVLVGFIGVIIALTPTAGNFGTGLYQIGSLVVLLGTLSSALNKILMRHLASTDDALTISIYPNIALVCITAPLLISSWQLMPYEHWLLFGLVGIITALAQYCVAQALHFTEASRLAPIDYSTLFWAITIDYIRWETYPCLSTLLGGLIIILSNLYIARSTQKNG